MTEFLQCLIARGHVPMEISRDWQDDLVIGVLVYRQSFNGVDYTHQFLAISNEDYATAWDRFHEFWRAMNGIGVC